MNSKKKRNLLEIMGDLLDEESLTDAQREELIRLLKNDPEARRFYSNHMDLHARLHLDYSADALPEAMPNSSPASRRVSQGKPSSLRKAVLYPVAAMLCVGLITFFYTGNEKSIATLVSSENAAWESSLPTAPGSSLAQGTLNLKSGLATIRFASGVEMTIEAPAKLELETPMKARLLAGSATIEVPKPARGFVLDTPGGYAVDHGTAFAVSVGDSTSFEVLEGEISVHSNDHSTSVTLTTKESARLYEGAIEKHQTLPDETVAKLPDGIVRLGTERSTSIIRNNLFEHLHPDFLMTKLERNTAVYERRSLLSFDLSETAISDARSARLRLNLVPSGLGYAAHLEKRNTFAVYGVTEEADETWVPGCLWEEAPQLNRAELLGNFEVARSQQTGSFGISNDALLDFLRNDQNRKVSLIVTRETPESQNRGLVHAFASDSHPEASGPTLELTF